MGRALLALFVVRMRGLIEDGAIWGLLCLEGTILNLMKSTYKKAARDFIINSETLGVFLGWGTR